MGAGIEKSTSPSDVGTSAFDEYSRFDTSAFECSIKQGSLYDAFDNRSTCIKTAFIFIKKTKGSNVHYFP
jgi:hypothetical protein